MNIVSLAQQGIQDIKRLHLIVGFRPFDVSTAEGRANERLRRVALTTGASALSKVIAIATALITVPLTLNYLGSERYGMWMTMSSVVAMLNFADFGVGNGVLNAVSSAYGQERHDAIRKHVSSGFFVLGLVALAILVLSAAVYPFVSWYQLFNVTSALAREESGAAFAVLIACFALTIPLSIVQRTQLGLQCGFVSNLWQCAANIMGLAAVIVAIHLKANLPVLMLAFVGSPLVIAAANSVVFFHWQEPRYAPKLSAVSRASVKNILHFGFLFFMLQIIGIVLFSSDNIVIAQILGAAAVTNYAVPQRMFSVVTVVIIMVLMPLWPAYGEAIARCDLAWVRKTLRKSFWLSLMFACAPALVLCLFGNAIIKIWVGHALATPLLLLIGLGLWQVIQAGGNAVCMYLNGANVIKFQVVTGALCAVVAIVLKIYAVRIMGVAGVIWSTNIAYVLLVGIPMYFFLRRNVFSP